MQDFAAQYSILALVVALCGATLVIMIQVISRDNILIDVRPLCRILWIVIPIFAIVLLWQLEKARIVDIVCILLDFKGSLVDMI